MPDPTEHCYSRFRQTPDIGLHATEVIAGFGRALSPDAEILCASIDVHECVDGGRCASVLPEAVNAPTFLRIDLQKKQVRVRDSQPPATAEHFEEVAGRIVMQGVQENRPDGSDGAAWTLMIEQDTGRMVATAATRQAAVVIFGACTEL